MSGTKETGPGSVRYTLAAILGAAGLALLSVSALGGVHPYEKWASQLGIDMNVSYDGTRVMEVKDAQIEAIERRAPGKMYTELQMSGMSSAVILREDLGKSFILLPSMGYYREDTLEGGLMQTSNGLEFSRIERTGREAINGHDATKYKTQFKDKDGKGAGFIWVTDTGVPIKMDMIYSSKGSKGQRISMEFTELNLRPQDPGYFELPPNLKPMDMGSMAGLSGLFGQGAAGSAPAVASTAGTAPAQGGTSDLATRQQECLREAQEAAQGQQQTKRGLGRMFSAASRVARRFGGPELGQAAADIYEADATVSDVSAAAKDLGISEDAVERCKNP
ncbi:MAG: hypothetical protein R3E82_15800 [Pseudomonadales bacterium]